MELLQPMLSSSPFFRELASFGSYSKLWISLAHGEWMKTLEKDF